MPYIEHMEGSYDGAFFALSFFSNTRQEAGRAIELGEYLVAWQLMVESCFWYGLFLQRRERVRRERASGVKYEVILPDVMDPKGPRKCCKVEK